MGNSANKKRDPNIDIYLELDRLWYHAGDMVSGVVFVSAKTDLAYQAIYVRFEGKEHTQWEEEHSSGQGTETRHYVGDHNILENEFILSKFERLPQGNYEFPFSMALPASLPGSFYKDDKIRIFYPLMAYMVDYSGQKPRQQYTHNMTVVEPLRLRPAGVENFKDYRNKLCCCFGQGTTRISLVTDTNVAATGSVVNVDVGIDNSASRTDYNKIQVVLKKKLLALSNDGHTHQESQNLSEVQKLGKVPKGQNLSYNTRISVPTIKQPTALGTFVANYYTIEVNTDHDGMCGWSEVLQNHIFMQTDSPQIEPIPRVPMPLEWRPSRSAPVSYQEPVQINYTPIKHLRHVVNR